MTPEKYTSSRQIQNVVDNLYRRGLLKRFVFDEVHCISLWGRSFRPNYLQLANIRKTFPEIPCLALTATADARTIMDIQHLLGLSNCNLFRHSFNRQNLSLNVLDKCRTTDKEIVKLIRNKFPGESGIVYCRTKKECERLQKTLAEENIVSAVFHADVKPALKEEVLIAWMTGEIPVVVATIAFGLGKYWYFEVIKII